MSAFGHVTATVRRRPSALAGARRPAGARRAPRRRAGAGLRQPDSARSRRSRSRRDPTGRRRRRRRPARHPARGMDADAHRPERPRLRRRARCVRAQLETPTSRSRCCRRAARRCCRRRSTWRRARGGAAARPAGRGGAAATTTSGLAEGPARARHRRRADHRTGVATIACSSAVAPPGECEQALGGLRLARGSFLAARAPSAAFLAAPARGRRGRSTRSACACARAWRAPGSRGRGARPRTGSPPPTRTADRALRPLAPRRTARRRRDGRSCSTDCAPRYCTPRRRHPRRRPRRLQGRRDARSTPQRARLAARLAGLAAPLTGPRCELADRSAPAPARPAAAWGAGRAPARAPAPARWR